MGEEAYDRGGVGVDTQDSGHQGGWFGAVATGIQVRVHHLLGGHQSIGTDLHGCCRSLVKVFFQPDLDRDAVGREFDRLATLPPANP